MATQTVSASEAFYKQLGRMYGTYAGGFIGFVIFLAILEQLGVPDQQMHDLWIVQQPAARRKDRRGHAVVDQRIDDPHISSAHAGVEGERHLRRTTLWDDMHVRLDQVCLGEGRRGEGGEGDDENVTAHRRLPCAAIYAASQ